MKKKVLLLVLVVVLCVASFAGCASNRVYSRNVTEKDLKVATGDAFKLPTIELKGEGNVFYDPAKYANAVTVPAEAKNNEIILLYVPNITNEVLKTIEGKKDDKFYRYSIKVTLDAKYGKVYEENGKIELYIHGSNYDRIDEQYSNVKRVSLEDRKAKLEADNKKDKKSIEESETYTADEKAMYWGSKVEDGVYKYTNRIDGQVINYFVDPSANTSYEVTACIYVNGDVGKDLKDEKSKSAAVEKAYQALLAEANKEVAKYIAQFKA